LFEINAKKSVLKSINKLDLKTKEKLKEIFFTLKANPAPLESMTWQS